MVLPDLRCLIEERTESVSKLGVSPYPIEQLHDSVIVVSAEVRPHGAIGTHFDFLSRTQAKYHLSLNVNC